MSAPVRLVATAPGHAPQLPSGRRARHACPRCGIRRQTDPRRGPLCRDCLYVLPPGEQQTWNQEAS